MSTAEGEPPDADVSSSTDPLNHSSSWTYDSLGRVLSMSDPLGRAHAHAHPTPTNGAWSGVRVMAGSGDNTAPPTAINAALASGQYQVGLGAFQSRGDPPRLEYYRDATFERGIAMAWDGQRRLSERKDQPGVLVSQIDPKTPNFQIAEMREQFGYEHGRAAPVVNLTTATYKGGGTSESAAFSVDEHFDVKGARGWKANYSWVEDAIARDSAGRVTKVEHQFMAPLNGTFGAAFTATPSEYTYAASGYVSVVKNADGEHTLDYDGRGLLKTITIKGEGTQVQTVYGFQYDSVGRSSEVDFPDGHTRTQKYDAEGRITERCYNYFPSNNNPFKRCYTATYDAAGNPTTLTDPEGTDTLTYDALNRLTQAKRTVNNQDAFEDYAYNALGALSKNAGTSLDDQRNKLSSNGKADAAVPATFGNAAVTLDGAGRVTAFKGATLKYDPRDRLVAVDKPIQNGTETEVYGHDAAMRRISRIRYTTINNQKTVQEEEYYLYEGPNLIAIVDKNNVVKQSILYAGVDQPLRLKTNFNTNLYFYEVDLAGNVRRLMAYGSAPDLGGYRYTAFGIPYAPDQQAPQPQIDQPLRWKGRPWSDFSSLYDVRARQWSPELGVFTAIDEYSYFDARGTLWGWPAQNPQRFRDPSGRIPPDSGDLMAMRGSSGEQQAQWAAGSAFTLALGALATLVPEMGFGLVFGTNLASDDPSMQAQADAGRGPFATLQLVLALIGRPIAPGSSAAPVLAEGGACPNVTKAGFARIEAHLTKLGAVNDPANASMLARLQAGERSAQALAFYQHELIESEILASGADPRAAHLQALEKQGIPYEPGYESQLYHPDVIRANPDLFNPAAWPK